MTMPGRADPAPRGAVRTEPPEPWQRELAGAFTRVERLAEFLGIRLDLPLPAGRTPLLVPRSFASRMARGDPADPLLRQVLPSPRENDAVNGFDSDPVGDRRAEVVPGLLEKYRSRALVLASPGCAIHCRFCFRQYLLRDLERRPVDFASILSALEGMTDVPEIILSGGDPLMLPDDALKSLLSSIDSMEHVRRVRFHTRMATVLPARIQPPLVDALRRSTKQLIFALHVNHPNELNEETEAALAMLRKAGVLLLNQTVLLRGINDAPDTLAALSEKLVQQGVMPYYLHQLDRARGTRHFEVPVEEGLEIVEQVRAICPGYMVPRYVQEIEGAPSKTPLGQQAGAVGGDGESDAWGR